MSVQTVHIAIDVRVDGDEISGHAGDGSDRPKPFSGWLGLIGALDGLLGNPRSSEDEPTVRTCVTFASVEQARAFAASATLQDALRECGATGAPEMWSQRTTGSGDHRWDRQP